VAAARKRIEAMVVGRKVMTSYNGMGWHVDAIDWTKDSSSSFTDQSGAQITYIRYERCDYAHGKIRRSNLICETLTASLNTTRRNTISSCSNQRCSLSRAC